MGSSFHKQIIVVVIVGVIVRVIVDVCSVDCVVTFVYENRSIKPVHAVKPVRAVGKLGHGMFEAAAAGTGSAGHTCFVDWASAASIAFSVRICFQGSLT